jgi:hypothetical protein
MLRVLGRFIYGNHQESQNQSRMSTRMDFWRVLYNAGPSDAAAAEASFYAGATSVAAAAPHKVSAGVSTSPPEIEKETLEASGLQC